MEKQLRDLDIIGNALVGLFHRLALFVIGAATVWAAWRTVIEFFGKSHATIPDLLLLFIYLEIGAMVGIYFKTNHMPVRFLVYIAITALTRHLVDLVAVGSDKVWEIVTLGGTTLLLSISILIIRMASNKYPSDKKTEDVS
jgi:phosphate starvation-inducible membrane PsiE